MDLNANNKLAEHEREHGMRWIAVVVEQGQQIGFGDGDKVAGACEDLHQTVVFARTPSSTIIPRSRDTDFSPWLVR